MKRLIFGLVALLTLGVAVAQPPQQFLRGAKPSPPQKILAAPPHLVAEAPPPQFAIVPKKLSVWLNNVTGDCVTAEEAFGKAVWSVYCGRDETFIPDAEVGRWAKKHGFWNGAALTDVMDVMQRDGLVVDGQEYKDGPYHRVDYSDNISIQSAIATGPVKIAIDANALPSGAGNHSGWYKFAGGRHPNTDHCVGLAGYGPAAFCFQSLGVPLPAGVDPAKPNCYLLFTWGTIGVVDHDWLQGTCTEAWVRNPTTPGQDPLPPPLPPPPPVPIPPVNGRDLLILAVIAAAAVGVLVGWLLSRRHAV